MSTNHLIRLIILLKKLSIYEVRGVQLSWFTRYILQIGLSRFIVMVPSQNYVVFFLEFPKVLSVALFVVSTKFLRVYIDQHLSWKEHIKDIYTKITETIDILSRLTLLVPPQIRNILYYILIYTNLTYCNIVWSSTYKSYLQE